METGPIPRHDDPGSGAPGLAGELFRILSVVCFLAISAPARILAQECVAVGGCAGDVPAGMCGTSTEPVETGTGCDGLLNCQKPEILSGPVIEVEPMPVSLEEPPRFNVRMAFAVKSPWNVWARENNPNGQLQARWLDPQGRVSTCQSNLTDQSKVWVAKQMTCAQMWSTRNVDGNNTSVDEYSLVVASCGPPCNPDQEEDCPTLGCHKWKEIADVPFSIPEDQLEEFCPPKRCPEGECCTGAGSGGSSGGFSLGGGGGWGRGGGVGQAAPGQSLATPAVKMGTSPVGRFWSHTFAERILPRADSGHVWLFTKDAVFWEFWDIDGDGTFDKNSPSDIESTLREVGSGWELRTLDGTVTTYGADGQWTATRDRNGNTIAGTYAAGVLESVDMPDKRRLVFTYHADGLLASMTEVGVDGMTSRTWSYTWSGPDLTRIDRPDGTAWLYRYDDPALPGYLTRRILRGTNGGLRILDAREYDAYGNLVREWKGDESPTGPNAIGLTLYHYSDPWNPTVREVTDPLGVLTVTNWLRDPDSNVPLVTRRSGECSGCGVGPNTQQFYEDRANPMKVTRSIDARVSVTLFQYDGNGQRISRTEAFMTALERTTTWEYDETYPSLVTAIEQPSTSGSPAVRRTSRAFDAAGNSIVRTDTGVENGSAFSLATVTAYNSAGRPETIDPPGFGTGDRTRYTYDAGRGHLFPVTRTDPLIGATSFAYDPINRRTSVTDPNGVIIEMTYDSLDRLISFVQKGASSSGDLMTRQAYNEFGDLLRTILPEGNVVEYGYDGAGRIISIERRPDLIQHGERTFYTLNGLGQRNREEFQVWNGDAWVTESAQDFIYSSGCNLDKIITADGSVTEFQYDCAGNLEREWDAINTSNSQQNPASRVYTYDELNRLTKTTELWGGAGGGVVETRYGYDVQDHVTLVVDGNATTSSFLYGDRDLITQEVSEISGTTRFFYNEHGQLMRRIDARGVSVERQVDELDRVRFEDYTDNGLDTLYTYDAPAVPFSKGQLTSVSRHGETVDYRYDRFGRVIQDGALTYELDKNGNRISIGYPGGVVATLSYDFADRPSTLSAGPAGSLQAIVTSSSYKSRGPLEDLVLGNGLVEARLFDDRYLPTLIQVPERLEWSYVNDAVGNITSVVDEREPAMSRSFEYQPVQFYLTSGDGPWGSLDWIYDRAGNRLSETVGGAITTYSYRPNAAGLNSPQLVAVQGASGAASILYTYDVQGSIIGKSSGDAKVAYLYDEAGRLAMIRGDDSTSGTSAVNVLRYDGRSLLDRSTLTPSLGHPYLAWVTRSTYDSGGLFHHRSIERYPVPSDPREAPSIAGDDYVFYFADRPVAQLELRTQTGADGSTSSSSRWIFLTTDPTGAPILATDVTGSTVWTGGFRPFGVDWRRGQTDGATANGIFLRFPGQWTDETWTAVGLDEDLAYNVNRWYQPAVGRYSRADPLTVPDRLLLDEGADHLYAYAQWQPLNLIDPLGLLAVAAGATCKNFDDIVQGLMDLANKKCCSDYFQSLGANLSDLVTGTPPFLDVFPTPPINNMGPKLGRFNCRSDKSTIFIVEKLCKKGRGGRGRRRAEKATYAALHELAHYADCNFNNNSNPGEDGQEAEIACLGQVVTGDSN